MASWYHYYDTDYYVLEEFEREVNPEPGQGAAAAAEGGHLGEGAIGLMDDMKLEGHQNQQDILNQEGEGNQEGVVDQEDDSDPEDDGGNEDPQEQDLEEPMVPRSRRRRPRIPFQFTAWQLNELENVFEETQYPDLLMRRELGRQMNVPEAKVQTWFNNRRAKYRKNQRESMLRRIPPGVPDYIFMTDVEEP